MSIMSMSMVIISIILSVAHGFVAEVPIINLAEIELTFTTPDN